MRKSVRSGWWPTTTATRIPPSLPTAQPSIVPSFTVTSIFAPMLFVGALLITSTTVRGQNAISPPQGDEVANAVSDGESADAPDGTSPANPVPAAAPADTRCPNLLVLDERKVCRYAAAFSAESGDRRPSYTDATPALRMR